MPLEQPEGGLAWIDVPLQEPIDLICCGEPGCWRAHWVADNTHKRAYAIRCTSLDGRDCPACARGLGYRVRYVIPVLHDGRQRVIELGRVQWDWISVREAMNDWVGARFRVRRERPARNAPLLIQALGHVHVSPEQHADIRGMVYLLGSDSARAWAHNQSAGGR